MTSGCIRVNCQVVDHQAGTGHEIQTVVCSLPLNAIIADQETSIRRADIDLSGLGVGNGNRSRCALQVVDGDPGQTIILSTV